MRHFWDPENHYYLGEDGHAASGANCTMAVVHVLRHQYRPHAEDAGRVRRICEHALESHDTYGSGGLLNAFDDPGQGGSMRSWLGSAVLTACALVLKHSDSLGIEATLRERVEWTFRRYFELANALVNSWDRRDNQTVAVYFQTLAYAYWATGEVRFLDRARRLAETLAGVYTTDEPLSIRNVHRGCFPDWTWWYAQAMDWRVGAGDSLHPLALRGGRLETGWKVRESFEGRPAPGLTANAKVLMTQRGREVYVHLYQDPEATGVMLAEFAAQPRRAILLNTGQELEARLDRRGAALWYQTPFLRIRGLPVNELLDEVLVVKLEFDGGRINGPVRVCAGG